jgi:HlyD family secretion protein
LCDNHLIVFLRRSVPILALILAAAGLIWYWTRPQPIPVTLGRIERGRVEATVSNTRAGTVRACRRARLAPASGGQVARLPVREGERVSQGQVLLELWNEDLQAQLKLAESEAATAEARAEEVCLLAKLARSEAERLRKLHEQGLTADDAVERAMIDAEARTVACRAAKAAARESSSRIAVARAALERMVLRAPFHGVVADLNAELGEVVIPSPPGIPTPPALDLIEEGCLFVRAPIDEVDATRVRPGMPVRVTLDAFPGRSFEGRVRRVAPYVLDREKQARTVDVDVEIVLPPGENALLPGYSADIEVLLEAREDVLRIPSEALLDGRKVLVLSGGFLEERQVSLGIASWQLTELLPGSAVKEGELVVLSLDRPGVEAGARAAAEGPLPPGPPPAAGSP